MKTLVKIFPFLALLILIAACSSTGDVACMPLPLRCKIDTVYIENDPAQRVEVVIPELVRQISEKGFKAVVVDPGTAPDNGYTLKYSIKFSKGSVKTLNYVKLEMLHDKRVIGYIVSDASDSTARFNSTGDRLQPLVDRLFQFAIPTNLK